MIQLQLYIFSFSYSFPYGTHNFFFFNFFLFFLRTSPGMWDPSFLSRDQTCVPCAGREEPQPERAML